MKKLLFVMLMCIVSINLYAQTKVHIVQRGETVVSVAKRYGVSVDDLKKANPNVNNYFYAGMKLTIPAKKEISNQQESNIASHSLLVERKSSNKEMKNSKKDNRSVFSARNGLDGTDFRSAGITFGSDFSDLVGLTYGVQGQFFLFNNFGATLNFGLNYGITDNPDMIIKIGPSYVYPINDWLYIMGTACYTLSLAKQEGESGNISGVSFIPTIGFAIKQFRIGLNGEVHWRNGGSVGPGAFINFSYAF